LTTSESSQNEQHRSAARGFFVGLLAGTAVGLLTDVMPVVGLGLFAVGAFTVYIRAVANPEARHRGFATAAGFLIGLGALFLYGSWNTISACAKTDDFCGNANVVPLLAAAIALLVAGLLIAAGAVASARGIWPRRTS
jgi:apolipoprotein N-acyltransferase